jgi:hypothetical protein
MMVKVKKCLYLDHDTCDWLNTQGESISRICNQLLTRYVETEYGIQTQDMEEITRNLKIQQLEAQINVEKKQLQKIEEAKTLLSKKKKQSKKGLEAEREWIQRQIHLAQTKPRVNKHPSELVDGRLLVLKKQGLKVTRQEYLDVLSAVVENN